MCTKFHKLKSNTILISCSVIANTRSVVFMTAGTKETTTVSDIGKHTKSESVVSLNTPASGNIEDPAKTKSSLKASPVMDIKPSPAGDIKPSPAGDIKVSPTVDTKASPAVDIQALPAVDIKTSAKRNPSSQASPIPHAAAVKDPASGPVSNWSPPSFSLVVSTNLP